MKKTFIAIAALSLLVLTACGGSTKGNWTDSDKDAAREALDAQKSSLESLVGAEKTEQIIDCALEKIEAQYENIDALNDDKEGLSKIGEDCAMEAMQ